MPGQNYQLVVKSGDATGKVYPILKPRVTIGRDPQCDVLINDIEVSRQHAVITLQAEGYTIEDLGSTNGTRIENLLIKEPYFLAPGSVIRLGNQVSLLFERIPTYDPNATILTSSEMEFESASGSGLPEDPQLLNDGSFPNVNANGKILRNSPKRRLPIFVIVLLILFVVACLCGVVLFYIDKYYLWCWMLPFLPACQ